MSDKIQVYVKPSNQGKFRTNYRSTVFPGGEVFIQLYRYTCSEVDFVQIRAALESAADIMELLMVTDAVKREYPGTPVYLVCPYLPYARQDRVSNEGESLSIRVMCDLINSMNFSSVEIWDAHSDVSLALLNNVKHTKQEQLAYATACSREYVLVSPDTGATKKTFALGCKTGRTVLQAHKHRDTGTGEISGTRVDPSYFPPAQDFLIVDDICDGGRTFIELARVLKGRTTGCVDLYVTHGIFSKGFEKFDGLIDTVYCANIFSSVKPDPNGYMEKILRNAVKYPV